MSVTKEFQIMFPPHCETGSLLSGDSKYGELCMMLILILFQVFCSPYVNHELVGE